MGMCTVRSAHRSPLHFTIRLCEAEDLTWGTARQQEPTSAPQSKWHIVSNFANLVVLSSYSLPGALPQLTWLLQARFLK